jgi:ATP-binding cassette, subfamily B, bacterial
MSHPLPGEALAVSGDVPVAIRGTRSPPTGQATGSVEWGVVRRLAARYFRPHLGLSTLYVIVAIVAGTLLPVGIAQAFGSIMAAAEARRQSGLHASVGTAVPTSRHAAESVVEAGPTKQAAPEGATSGADRTPIFRTYVWWVLLSLATVGLAYAQGHLGALLDGRMASSIQTDLFAALLRQSPRYFHSTQPGQLTLVVNQVALQAQIGLRQLVIDPLTAVAGLVVIAGAIWRKFAQQGVEFSRATSIALGATVAAAMLVQWFVQRTGRQLSREGSTIQHQQLGMASVSEGAFGAPEEVQAMQAEPLFAQRYGRLLAESLASRLQQSRTLQGLNAMNVLPTRLMLAVVIGFMLFGSAGAIGLTPALLFLLYALIPDFMGGLQSVGDLGVSASMAWPALATISRVLDAQPEIVDAPTAADLEPAERSLEARNLVFSYQPGITANVLNGVSFRVPRDQVTGLIARPGQGKTTLFRLALRFYDAQQGELRAGGRPVGAYTLASLRRQVAFMAQHPAFFFGSVRENFQIAKPDVTDAEIVEACEITKLWPILTQVFGADPLRGEFAAGSSLSGGQQKLFALTRCLLRRPAMILLDEPTAGMGPLEKFPLIDSMRGATEGRVTMVVDHDILWQLRFCQRFLVLDGGKLVQEGTGADLLEQPGLFRQLYDVARSGQVNPADHATLSAAERMGPHPCQ